MILPCLSCNLDAHPVGFYCWIRLSPVQQRRTRVWLDEDIVRNPVAADAVEGFVLLYERDDFGKLIVRDGNATLVRRDGNVRIEVPDRVEVAIGGNA